MKTTTEELKQKARQLKKEVQPSWMEKQMVKLYLKSPPKIQYALAKYGIKKVVKRKKAELEHMIKH